MNPCKNLFEFFYVIGYMHNELFAPFFVYELIDANKKISIPVFLYLTFIPRVSLCDQALVLTPSPTIKPVGHVVDTN